MKISKKKRVRDAQKREMYRLYLMGKHQGDIAKLYECTRERVVQCIQDIAQETSQAYQDHVAWYKAVQTEQLRLQHAEAIEAWEKSKLDAKKEVISDDGNKVTKTVTIEGQCGDPRFLSEARASLEHIRKIWGMDAPSKQEIMNGQALQVVEVIVDAESVPSADVAGQQSIAGPVETAAQDNQASSDPERISQE